jgi:2-polyprenyl-6-methoxyphenol hydroxylase-like FAD-dependent oxidoreductase
MPNAPRIIVVGAGPVGLLTALGLARAGATVTVIDADPVLNDSPRAMTYTDPTMQLMERLGILEAAEKVGIQSRHINFVWPNDDMVITIDTVKAEPNRVHPLNPQFSQDALGAIAMEALLQLPDTQVLFNHKLAGIAQTGTNATVTVVTPAGSKSLTADYVIGCDGASSTTRRLLGLEFEGITWPERFIATNVY